MYVGFICKDIDEIERQREERENRIVRVWYREVQRFFLSTLHRLCSMMGKKEGETARLSLRDCCHKLITKINSLSTPLKIKNRRERSHHQKETSSLVRTGR